MRRACVDQIAPRVHRASAFTVIELLVVMAALGLLLAIVAPQYAGHVDRARETTLKHNLRSMRDAIDKFNADHARYPRDLKELVEARYLREVPVDALTDRSDTWVLVPPKGQAASAVFDVRSGAAGIGRNGTAYASW